MEDTIDFDPTTEEGRTDINDDETQPLINREDGSRMREVLGRLRGPRFSRARHILGLGGAQQGEEIAMDYLSREGQKTTAEERIQELYPEWDPSKSNFTFDIDKYDRVTVRLNHRGAKPHLLTSPKLPRTILNNLGRLAENIEEYNKAKKDLDIFYTDNTISRENGFDVRINEGDVIEVYDSDKNKWYTISTKMGDEFRSFGKITNKIKNALGESSESKLKRLITSKAENDEKLTTLYPEVVDVNKRIDDNNRRRGSISSQISEAESEFEMYHNSQRQTDETVQQIETIRGKKYELIAENNKLIDENEALTKRRDALESQIHELEDNGQELEDEMEIIEEKLPLKERIKLIFKKYGFTAFAVASAVGIVIGVIINSLKSGLSSVAAGVGKGLKTIGEKLAQILPGMVGAIASFIFKTAGEVVGFLAKNAWLLIIAVVLYFVERYKKK